MTNRSDSSDRPNDRPEAAVRDGHSVAARAVIDTLYKGLGFADTRAAVDPGHSLEPDALAGLRGTRADGPAGKVARARAHEATGPLPRIDVADEGTPAPADIDYVVKGLLGEGGMGRVVCARQRSLGRDVAIKVLRESATYDPRAGEMLLAEALVTGSLEHPSIVPVHAVGTDSHGAPVLVMKRIEGVAWSDLLKNADHDAWAHVEPEPAGRLVANLEILMRVCDALHYAHSRGIIHRDVKPSNVMVGSFGEVYVVDWGVALRKSSVVQGDLELVGTLGFMAPEMAAGRVADIDARSDVYLAGATLHYVLARRPRHSGDELTELLLTAFESVPATYGPDVPAELAAICNRACAADKSARFEDALALRRALADFLRHRSSVALCRRLSPRLDELTRLVGERDATRDADTERDTFALLSECRFGYEQALREWPGNGDAKDGLRRVLGAAVRVEVSQGDAVGARAALVQLRELDDAAASELAALADRVEAEARAREAKLHRLERDADMRIGARQRATILALMLPLAIGMNVFAARVGSAAVTYEKLVGFAVLINAALWTAIALGRRRLLETTVNRRLVFGAAIMLAIWLVNRIAGWAVRTPIHLIAASDLFVLAAVAGAVWTPYVRRFAAVSILAAVLGVAAVSMPEHWLVFFSVSSFALLGAIGSMYLVRRSAPEGVR